MVLLACGTGRDDLTNGDGVYGLRRAFTLADARSQVGTLRKVDDQVTKDIMVAYYENLLQVMGHTEAMRQVQLEMLKNPQTETPSYSAAFVSICVQWRLVATVTLIPGGCSLKQESQSQRA